MSRLLLVALLSATLVGAQERRLREGRVQHEPLPAHKPTASADASRGSVAILIELRSGSREDREAVLALIERSGGRVIHAYRLMHLLSAEIPGEAVAGIRASSSVAAMGRDQETAFQIDRSVPALGVAAPWRDGVIGTGETVLLPDTGVRSDHAALRGRVQSGIYLSGNTTCPPAELSSSDDFDGHGTHMAGIIASGGTPLQPNFQGVARGLGNVINAKVGCQGGVVLSSTFLAAVEAALMATPSPIVVSAATSAAAQDDDVFSRAVDTLVQRFDLIWVNAAGNSGPEAFSVASPATAYNAISVANLDLLGTADRSQAVVFESSGRGPTPGGRFKPDVAAPGTNISSTGIVADSFVARTGTSMAAAHIAGAAAILRQAGVRNRMAMKALLINTTDRDGWDPDDGWGFVNVERAYAQRQNGSLGAVGAEAGASVSYRVIVPPGGSYFASLVWERNFSGSQSVLRNLDLSVYRADTSAIVRRSLFLTQNVEQVAFRNTSPSAVSYIVRVETRGAGAAPQNFALASSLPLEAFAAPKLDVTCTFPPTAAPGAVVDVVCTARNVGGLPYFAVNYSVTIANAFAGAASAGAIGSGVEVTTPVPVVMPTAPGTFAARVEVTGISFGLIENASVAGSVFVDGSGSGAPPTVLAVVNAASFGPGFTSGSWVTITGVQLSATTRQWVAADFDNGRLPVELDGVRVTINGIPAYPAFISPEQINVLAPDDAAVGELDVQVSNSSGASLPLKALKEPIAPALFTFSAGGKMFAAAIAADGTNIAPEGALGSTVSRPARPGEVITLYATGCGPTAPELPAGMVVGAPAPVTSSVEVLFGETVADVLYAGVVSSGLCQINVEVPELEGDEEDSSVTLTIGDVSAPTTPVITIR